MPIHVSDTAATSQDDSVFRMQGAEGCGGESSLTNTGLTNTFSGVTSRTEPTILQDISL